MKDRESETEQMFGENGGERAEFQAQAGNGGRAGDGASKDRQTPAISEEQARVLLMQDKMETEQRMKDAGSHKTKVLAIIIGAAMFLVAVGVATWVIVGLNRA